MIKSSAAKNGGAYSTQRERITVNRNSLENPEGKKPIGRPRRRRNNIKIVVRSDWVVCTG
jgi:hypothetical protein